MAETREPAAQTQSSTPSPESSRTPSGRRLRRPSPDRVKALRVRVASVLWLAAVVCALFLAVGALIVALQMNRDNPIVAFVLDGAHKLDFGELKKFTGKNAEVKSALTNWGIAAVIYLLVGKVLDRVIRP